MVEQDKFGRFFATHKAAFMALAALCISVCSVFTASADDWECRALQIQIDSAPRTQVSGRNSPQAARYAKAISAQDAQIGKAKSQLRSLGCGGSMVTLGGGKASCSKLNSALKSMNANMTKLKAQHARLSKASGGTVSSRDVLKARYNAAGCNGGSRVITVKQNADDTKKQGILAILGDTKARRDDRKKDGTKQEIPGLSYSGDTFRTLCVRKCDGYYFPISFSTTKDNFKRDTVACESMCPGTEVELFMHKVPEEESEDMTTAKGEPYKAMSYAFAYRRDGVGADPGCRCLAVQGMAGLGNNAVSGEGMVNKAIQSTETTAAVSLADHVPVPTPRGDTVYDRESIADAAGQFTDADVLAIFEPQLARTNADGSIRVVGPVFLPDPSGAIELKVPVRPLMR